MYTNLCSAKPCLNSFTYNSHMSNLCVHFRINSLKTIMDYTFVFSALPVVIWSDMLGGVHMWSGTIPWATSAEATWCLGHWRETGQACQHSLHR